MLQILTFLILGIFTGSLLNIHIPMPIILITIALLVFASFVVKRISLQKILLNSCFYMLGFACVTKSISEFSIHHGKTNVRVQLLAIPTLSKSGKVYTADAVFEDGSKLLLLFYNSRGKASLQLPGKGDVIALESKITPGLNPNRLMSRGYYGSSFVMPWQWRVESKAGNTSFGFVQSWRVRLDRWLADTRNRVVGIFRSLGLDGDEHAIVAAMTLGDRSYIDEELGTAYSHGGASHALALSGMHVGIIYVVMFWVLIHLALLVSILPEYAYVKGFRNPFIRWCNCRFIDYGAISAIVSFVILLLLWFYALLVGMMPSVVRAVVMLSLYTFVRIICRKADAFSVLCVTAFIMLLLSPLSIYNVGFQMSFLAMLGISLLFSRLSRLLYVLFPAFQPSHFSSSFKLPKSSSVDSSGTSSTQEVMRRDYVELKSRWWFVMFRQGVTWVWDCISLSLSAQVMVLPLVVFYFGYIPCYSLITGLVVSICAGAIIVLSFAVLLLSFIPVVANYVALLLTLIVRFQNGFLRWEASLPGAYVDDISFSIAQLVLAYIIVSAVCLLVHRLVEK